MVVWCSRRARNRFGVVVDDWRAVCCIYTHGEEADREYHISKDNTAPRRVWQYYVRRVWMEVKFVFDYILNELHCNVRAMRIAAMAFVLSDWHTSQALARKRHAAKRADRLTYTFVSRAERLTDSTSSARTTLRPFVHSPFLWCAPQKKPFATPHRMPNPSRIETHHYNARETANSELANAPRRRAWVHCSHIEPWQRVCDANMMRDLVDYYCNKYILRGGCFWLGGSAFMRIIYTI